MTSTVASLRRFLPGLARTSPIDRLRASLGALVGILLTGLVSTFAVGPNANLPLLIAPMGASAVLLFAAPTSPLAQPWSLLGGNIVSAIIGVTAARYVHDPILAAALAVGLAIGAMMLLGCLHPPSGAVALTAVLGGPAIWKAGYWFVASPVVINSLIILAIAILFNNATGRRYPHLVHAPNPHGTSDPLPMQRTGVNVEDLQAVIADYGEVLDVSPDELDALLNQAQIRAFNRRSGELTCGQIMSRDVVTVGPTTSLKHAWMCLVEHRIKALPVVNENRELVGIITQTDFMKNALLSEERRLQLSMSARARRMIGLEPRQPLIVADIMTRRVQSALPSTMISKIVPPMADTGLHHLPVVDEANRVVGIVTQSDLLAALFRRELGRQRPDPA
jgi:CBS domain-containing membrane protein